MFLNYINHCKIHDLKRVGGEPTAAPRQDDQSISITIESPPRNTRTVPKSDAPIKAFRPCRRFTHAPRFYVPNTDSINHSIPKIDQPKPKANSI